MKKILLLATVAILGNQLAAQVTITSLNVVEAGQKINLYSDNSTSMSLQTGGATHKNWDFSQLINDNSSQLNFFNPNWRPAIGNLIPTANLVVESDGEFTFLKKTNTSLKFVGSAVDTGTGPLEVNNYEFPVMYFPMSYGTVIKDSVIFSAEKMYFGMSPGMGAPVIDSFEIIIKGRFTFKGVGQGSVKLPNNVNVNNTLMVESISENFYIVNFYSNNTWSTLPPSYYSYLQLPTEIDTSLSHFWWSNESYYGFPLVQYDFYPNDDMANNFDYISSGAQATAVENANKVSVSVYPNPSSNVLLFKGLNNESAKAMVMDMQGKLVLTAQLVNNSLDISQLATGNYVVTVPNGNDMVQIQITKE